MGYIRIISWSLLCFLLAACSDKEKLSGTRVDIIAADDEVAFDVEKADLPMDSVEFLNKEVPQPFMNAAHCYFPLKFSVTPNEIWSSSLDFGNSKFIRIAASPLSAEGKIFCLDAAGIVYAIDPTDGKRIWRTSTLIKEKDGQTGGSMAYYGGKLVVTSSFSECFLLNAQDGKILWRIKLPAPCKGDGITVSDGKAYVMCGNNTLQAINIDTGKTVWSHSGTLVNSSFLGSAGVAVDNGVVFLSYSSGEIFALSAETGAAIWDSMFSKFSLTKSAHSFMHPRACPVIKDDIVYFSASNEQTIALDKKNGDRLWTCNVGGLQTPTVSGNSIFILCPKSELVCLNRHSGKLRWRCQLDSDKKLLADWYGQLPIGGHILMVSPTGKLIFVTSEGKIERTMKIEAKSDSISVNPIIVDGVMYVLLNDGDLVALK